VSIRFDHYGSQSIEHELSPTDVNILRFSVADLKETINVKPEIRNRRLEPTGLAKPSESRGLTDTGLGLASQEAAVRVVGWVWN